MVTFVSFTMRFGHNLTIDFTLTCKLFQVVFELGLLAMIATNKKNSTKVRHLCFEEENDYF